MLAFTYRHRNNKIALKIVVALGTTPFLVREFDFLAISRGGDFLRLLALCRIAATSLGHESRDIYTEVPSFVRNLWVLPSPTEDRRS